MDSLPALTLEKLQGVFWEELEVEVGSVEENCGSYGDMISSLGLFPTERLQIKFYKNHEAYVLVVTNFIRVWCRQSNQATIEKERKKYARPLKKQPLKAMTKMLHDMLSQDGTTGTKQYRADFKKDKLILKASMQVDVFPLSWEFECVPFGNRDQQALFLRDHLYKPQREMLKQLTFRLKQTPSSSSSSSSTSFSSSAYSGLRPDTGIPPKDYEAFSANFSFNSMLGPLYQDAMTKLTQSQWNFDEDPTLGTGGMGAVDDLAKKKTKTLDDADISLSVDAFPTSATAGDALDHKHDEGDEFSKTPSASGSGKDEVPDFVMSIAEVERRQHLERQLAAEKKVAKKQKRKQFV